MLIIFYHIVHITRETKALLFPSRDSESEILNPIVITTFIIIICLFVIITHHLFIIIITTSTQHKIRET